MLLSRRWKTQDNADTAWPAVADTMTLIGGIFIILFLAVVNKNTAKPVPVKTPELVAKDELERCQKELKRWQNQPMNPELAKALKALESINIKLKEHQSHNSSQASIPINNKFFVSYSFNEKVFFDTGEYKIEDKYIDEIKLTVIPAILSIAPFFENNRIELEIAGHTDNVEIIPGTKVYRDQHELSARRASSVLVSLHKILDKNDNVIKALLGKIHVSGYGENKPLGNKLPSAHEQQSTSSDVAGDRRVEFRFVVDPFLLADVIRAQPLDGRYP